LSGRTVRNDRVSSLKSLSFRGFPNSASPTLFPTSWCVSISSVAVHISSSKGCLATRGLASALGNIKLLLSTVAAKTSKNTNHQNTPRRIDEEKENPAIVLLELRRSILRDLLFFFDSSTTAALDGCSSSFAISFPSASCCCLPCGECVLVVFNIKPIIMLFYSDAMVVYIYSVGRIAAVVRRIYIIV